MNVNEIARYGLMAAMAVLAYFILLAWNEDSAQRQALEQREVAAPLTPGVSALWGAGRGRAQGLRGGAKRRRDPRRVGSTPPRRCLRACWSKRTCCDSVSMLSATLPSRRFVITLWLSMRRIGPSWFSSSGTASPIWRAAFGRNGWAGRCGASGAL